ncbi:MAG TPA: Ig-like domain-containing protein [Myxococcaceae bacterium]
MEPTRSCRSPTSRLVIPALVVSGSLLLAACHHSSSSKTLESIGVTPANPTLAGRSTVQLSATGTYTDHSTQDITGSSTWTSSAAGVATVSGAGLVSAIAPGTATITAASHGITGSTMLTVTPATLQSIAVTPSNPSIAKGTTQQLVATGTFSDATTQDLTGQVTWASDTASVATVSGAGLATGVAAGTANISASMSGVTGSTKLTVTAATLESISVSPPAPSVAKGITQQFTATGTYSDGSTHDVSMQVAWTSSMTGVATISDAAGSRGLASALTEGSTTILATLGAIHGQATLTVTPATLASISVTPTTPRRPLPLTLAFTATGVFTDHTTQDLTTQVTWASSSTAAATISNAAGSQGLASTVAAGTTTISATKGSATGSTLLTVTSGTLQSIAVTPADPSLAKGTTRQLTATGTYSDASTVDLTDFVTWESKDETVANLSNADGTRGLATGVDIGSTDVSATFGGKTGSTTVTVTAATLASIDVMPARVSLPRGLTEPFVATGTFSDGSTQLLTSTVSWSSTDAAVASIANSGEPGLATALSTGTTTIRAVQGNVTGSATLTVTDAILISIAVTPPSVTIPRSSTQQFTALGTFSDTSVVDLTTEVTWTSSDPSVVAISNAALSQGLATALAHGMVTLTAAKGAVSGTAGATVP